MMAIFLARSAFILAIFALAKVSGCKDSFMKATLVRPTGRKIKKTCTWVASRPSTRCTFKHATDFCPETCSDFAPDCESDVRARFKIPFIGWRKCIWVSRKPALRCGIKGVSNLCRATCGSLPTSAPTLCSTGALCGADVATTYGPLECDPSGLELTLLGQYSYSDDDGEATDVMVRFYGPAEVTQAAALVIVAPHGGDLEPTYMTTRTTDDEVYCPEDDDCVVTSDSYTREIATKIANSVIENYCKVPYLVVNELHRSKMDANRERPEATFDDPIAINAWQNFHDFIQDAQNAIQSQFGTIVNENDIEGIIGILFDVHGYAGYDWDDSDGGKFIQWGYRLSKDTLDQDPSTGHCPVDSDLADSSTRGSFTHARALPDQSLECQVRGPQSLGQRMNELLPMTSDAMCGASLPSFDYQNPKAISSNALYCGDDDGTCHYYSGGFDLEVHERYDWESIRGIHMNTVQAELPRCLRWATDESRDTIHDEVANNLSIVLCSFLRDLFGAAANTC